MGKKRKEVKLHRKNRGNSLKAIKRIEDNVKVIKKLMSEIK